MLALLLFPLMMLAVLVAVMVAIFGSNQVSNVIEDQPVASDEHSLPIAA